MSLACLDNNMMIDSESMKDIEPQVRKLKLASSGRCSTSSNVLGALSSLSLQENIKALYPSLNDEKIKEILEKSENNMENAKIFLNQLRNDQLSANSDFISYHKGNRKRRFNDFVGDAQCVRNSDKLGTTTPKFKITGVKDQNKTDLELLISKNMPQIIEELKSVQSTKSFEDVLTKHIESICSQVQTNSNIKDKDKIVEKFEEIVKDNETLKKTVVFLFKKHKENTQLAEENNKLKQELMIYKELLKKEQQRANHLSLALDHSNNQFLFSNDRPDDIY